MTFLDLELEALDRRKRIDLMHRVIVIREDDSASTADHDHKRKKRLMALIDNGFLWHARRHCDRCQWHKGHDRIRYRRAALILERNRNCPGTCRRAHREEH
jgi:hypothetical protein